MLKMAVLSALSLCVLLLLSSTVVSRGASGDEKPPEVAEKDGGEDVVSTVVTDIDTEEPDAQASANDTDTTQEPTDTEE